MLSCWQDGVLSCIAGLLKPNADCTGFKSKNLSNHSVPLCVLDTIKDERFLRAPRKLQEDYVESTHLLGSGCSGDVKVFSKISCPKTKFAVKRIKPNKTMTAEMVRAEVQNHLRCDCPHVVKLLQVYESSSIPYSTKEHLGLVMECLEGGDLHARLKERRRFSEQGARVAVQQILSSLDYLHSRGIVHCDIKLDNFVYDKKGSDRLKLVDFGFSQVWDAVTDRPLTDPVGTLFFTAPEVLWGHYTSQCDLWSTGVIAFMLLSGTAPFPKRPTAAMQQKDILSGSFYTTGELWFSVSTQAKHFVRSLIVVDANRRLTAKEALEHPWIAGMKEVPVAKELTTQLVDAPAARPVGARPGCHHAYKEPGPPLRPSSFPSSSTAFESDSRSSNSTWDSSSSGSSRA